MESIRGTGRGVETRHMLRACRDLGARRSIRAGIIASMWSVVGSRCYMGTWCYMRSVVGCRRCMGSRCYMSTWCCIHSSERAGRSIDRSGRTVQIIAGERAKQGSSSFESCSGSHRGIELMRAWNRRRVLIAWIRHGERL